MRAGARQLATTKTPPGGRVTGLAASAGVKATCSAAPGAASRDAACQGGGQADPAGRAGNGPATIF